MENPWFQQDADRRFQPPVKAGRRAVMDVPVPERRRVRKASDQDCREKAPRGEDKKGPYPDPSALQKDPEHNPGFPQLIIPAPEPERRRASRGFPNPDQGPRLRRPGKEALTKENTQLPPEDSGFHRTNRRLKPANSLIHPPRRRRPPANSSFHRKYHKGVRIPTSPRPAEKASNL